MRARPRGEWGEHGGDAREGSPSPLSCPTREEVLIPDDEIVSAGDEIVIPDHELVVPGDEIVVTA